MNTREETKLSIGIILAIIALVSCIFYVGYLEHKEWKAYTVANECSKTGNKEVDSGVTYEGEYYSETSYEWHCTKTNEIIWR